ncbi:MAG: hypothetical protein DRP24_01410, partial [Thermotoga sp.]
MITKSFSMLIIKRCFLPQRNRHFLKRILQNRDRVQEEGQTELEEGNKGKESERSYKIRGCDGEGEI